MAKITYANPTLEFNRIIPTPTTPRAYRAHLYDESGTLAKVNGVIYFLADTGVITELEPPMLPFCAVLEEVPLPRARALRDRLVGVGAAGRTTPC